MECGCLLQLEDARPLWCSRKGIVAGYVTKCNAIECPVRIYHRATLCGVRVSHARAKLPPEYCATTNAVIHTSTKIDPHPHTLELIPTKSSAKKKSQRLLNARISLRSQLDMFNQVHLCSTTKLEPRAQYDGHFNQILVSQSKFNVMRESRRTHFVSP